MKKEIIAVALFWLSIITISFWWNLTDEKKEREQLAFETARAFFQQIVITRSWNAGHGGVYVPVTKDLQPNPYLDDPLRDLLTDKGIMLTKINPAYMTRQIGEIASLENSIKFHITSLNPIRPGNKPEGWESKWLRSFEQGNKEHGGFFTDDQGSFFRYMAPLTVNDNCLKCHAKQGYRAGDVRGGISVTIPYLSKEKNIILITGYTITTVVGIALIIFGGILLERKRSLLLHTNNSLKKGIEEREKLIHELKEANSKIKSLYGIVPICMYCKEIRDDKGYWNQLEKFISEHTSAEFSHSICPKCMKEKHPEVNSEVS